jgi:hypothetical protein
MPPSNNKPSESLDLRSVLRWTGLTVCAVWMALSLYSEFFAANPDNYSFRSPAVEARMRACNGDFQHRYACKDAAMIAQGQRGFVVWIGKVLIVLGPPLALYVLMRIAYPNAEDGGGTAYRQTPTSIRRRRVK